MVATASPVSCCRWLNLDHTYCSFCFDLDYDGFRAPSGHQVECATKRVHSRRRRTRAWQLCVTRTRDEEESCTNERNVQSCHSSASLDALKAVPICIQPDEAVWKGCIQTGELVTKNSVKAVRRSKGKCNKRLKRIVHLRIHALRRS